MNSMQTSGTGGKTSKSGLDDVHELVAATPTQRNWRGILISLLVIGLVSSLIVTCVILLTPPDLGPRIRGHLITLEDLVKATYRVQHDNAAWVTDYDIAFRDDDGGVSVYNVRDNTTTVLVSNITMRQKHSERFLVSPDMSYVLLIGKEEKLTEYTGEAPCWLLSVSDGRANPLKPEPWSEPHPPLQYAAWVPRPGGSALLMVHDGNLYYKEWALSADSYPITKDGSMGLVHHGVPDILYAEHILRSDHAVWPSPGGTMLLFFTINCTAVHDLQYTEYGASAEASYPQVHSVKYPRAGTTNPALTVTVVNVSKPSQLSYHTVLPPSSLSNRELYAAGVRWLDDISVSVTWYNRRQNASFVTMCSAPAWQCQPVYQSQSAHGWVPIGDGPVYSENGSSAVLLDRVQDGDNGVFTQIFMVELGGSRSVTQMTQGPKEVHQILAWTGGFIYYLSSVEGSPGQRHLHRVTDDSSPLHRTVECLTCLPTDGDSESKSESVSESESVSDSDAKSGKVEEKVPCLQYEAVMRKGGGGGRYALRCVGPEVPKLTLPGPEVTLRNNTALREAAANLSLPAVHLMSVPLSEGREIAVRLLVPPQFRDGDAAAYPLLLWLAPSTSPDLDTAGAPGAADHRWRVDWPAYLAAQQSFVVATVELSNSPPEPDPEPLSREPAVGASELAALRRVMTHLTEKLPFVSDGRVLAAGREYGGYLALSLLGSVGPQQLRCAVAMAPVTSWELYASAAAERRLGMPEHNHRGYSESELGGGARAAAAAGAPGSLVGRRLMLVHGTADTSVSVQHTLLLSRRLERAGAIFRQMLYPDEGHELSGVREHLYRTLDQYLHECFLPDNVRELVSEVI